MARYKFLNVNPINAIEEDCVCRAISLSLNEDYYIIQEKLNLVSKLFECDMLCVCCYKFLLDEVYKLERIEEFQGMTINDFAKLNPIGIYLIRVNGHLTCVINGICYDIWNCLDEVIDLVWKIK